MKLKGMSPVQYRTHSMSFDPSKFLEVTSAAAA